MRRRTLLGELSAEFLGTFVILIFGIGVVAQVVFYGGKFGNCIVIPFAWGWGVALAIYVAGGISGADLNPAVTLAFAVRRGLREGRPVLGRADRRAARRCAGDVLHLPGLLDHAAPARRRVHPLLGRAGQYPRVALGA